MTMKFNAIVGNPPYQTMANGNHNAMSSIYHLFIGLAFDIANTGTFIHPAKCLFGAGNIPRQWNHWLLSNSHFKVINYWKNSICLFPNVLIRGGISITYWNKNKKYKPIHVFTPYPDLESIKNKVHQKKCQRLSSIITNRGIYKFSDKVYNDHPEIMSRTSDKRIASSAFERMPELFLKVKPVDDFDYIQLYGNYKGNRVFRWFRKDYIQPTANLNAYKVIIPKADGNGFFGERLCNPIIVKPLIGFTETYISIGETKLLQETKAILKYVETKFVRSLLGIHKITQNNKRELWSDIPLQDFTDNSDIDWTKSIADIDCQLYEKYDLSQSEIDFIETHVQPME